jgi:hypothetical protein
MADLFDMELRARRRDRAARSGVELFLFERVFADCLERIGLIERGFERALLIGCPDPTWPARLREFANAVDTRDPGPVFAARSGGARIVEDGWEPPDNSYDLVVALGTLDTVNDLPLALRLIVRAMTVDALLIGAISGGETLPRLRSAMRAADAAAGVASAHVHPRIEASAVAPLLSSAGLAMPVVDVDRVEVSYVSLAGLVRDLRAMGSANVLHARPRSGLSRRAYAAAAKDFQEHAEDGRTTETFEILHLAAWKSSDAHG